MEKRHVIGMIGGSGSGKTTILDELQSQFSKHDFCVISMDDYYLPKELQPKDQNGITNYDLPACLDHNRFLKDLMKLLGGQTVSKKEYTFNNDSKTPATKNYFPSKVIMCEGLFLYSYPNISTLLDYKVYVHTREAIQLARRIKRDRIERNYPLSDVLYRFEHHVLPSYDRFVRPHKNTSHLLIDTLKNRAEGVSLLKNKITEYINNSI